MKNIILFVCLIFIWSCAEDKSAKIYVENVPKYQDIIITKKNYYEYETDVFKIAKKRFDRTKKIDSIEYKFIDSLCFLVQSKLKEFHKIDTTIQADRAHYYLKTGNFITKNKRHALLINLNSTKNFTYSLTFYEETPKGWNITTQTASFEIQPISFEVIFDDYNFDGNNDVCIRIASLNGGGREYYELWLYGKNLNPNSANEISNYYNFTAIPTPIIDKDNKRIKSSLNLGCAAHEFRNTTYIWHENWLFLTKSITYDLCNDGSTAQVLEYKFDKNENSYILHKQRLVSLDTSKWEKYLKDYDL